MLAEFWLRKVRLPWMRSGATRCAFALRAAVRDRDAASARAWVGAIAGEDYRRLERTVRLPAARAQWGVDWKELAVLSIMPTNDIVWTPLAAGSVAALSTSRLSALRHAALERELLVEGEGSAGSSSTASRSRIQRGASSR